MSSETHLFCPYLFPAVQGVVGPPQTARHISTYDPKNKTAAELLKLHTPTFIDMGLLAHAR